MGPFAAAGRSKSVALVMVLVGVGVAGCQSSEPETACPDAEARIGHQVCVHRVPDRGTWDSIAFLAEPVDQVRTTTYMVPARKDARLPTVFVDASAFEMPKQSLHFQFLTGSFPEFETLEYEEYVELTQDPELREWFAGGITEFHVSPEETVFGFYVWDQQMSLETTITCDQFRDLYRTMDNRVGVGPVAVVPTTDLQRQVLADCDVPQHDPSLALDYEVYTNATGCGTVRRYTLAELAVASTTAAFGWQDILVIDEAPLDIETIISGIVTGTRQGELSHLNVRSASRGTPNCYVRNAYDLLAQWDGQLVQLECGASQATVVPITPDEAQACWDELRPDPVQVAEPDLEWMELTGLLDLPTQTAEERLTGVTRYGSKGTNLATLYQRIASALQLDGFLIPFYYYDQFVQTNSWSVDLGAGPETLTFAETIDRYLSDQAFLTDGALRRERLIALEVAMQAASCDPAFVAMLETQIPATFGADTIMVRFRSSSNAEDALGFNGAGLYSSTSACLADETDGDLIGPSHCDPDKSSERDLCRAMRRVWSSLWKMKAFEEREWYGIDHSKVAMAILVNTRTKGELGSMVAFTGNPLVFGDDRYLINAQAGEVDVVAALPGVWPEKDLLEVQDGQVIAIERARGSTELPEGEWVLSDAQLGALGGHLWDIVGVYPVDEEAPPGTDILLDTEWKVRSDGQLIVKQVRPFAD